MTTATLVAEIDVVGLAKTVADSITPYGARERVLPPEIAQRSVSRRGVMTAVCVQSFACAGFGDVRTLAVVGDQVLAAKVIAVPRADRDVGVFCAEAVVVDEPQAAIDIRPLGGPEARRSASGAVRRAERVMASGPAELLPMARFTEMLDMVWHLHVYDMVLAPELSRQDADEHFAKLTEWKHTARETCALRQVLEDAFGVDWTERCLDRHFFA